MEAVLRLLVSPDTCGKPQSALEQVETGMVVVGNDIGGLERCLWLHGGDQSERGPKQTQVVQSGVKCSGPWEKMAVPCLKWWQERWQ